MHLKKISANKSSITFADGTVVYFSYSKAVAAFIPGRGFVESTKHYSASTSRHIGEFHRIDCPTATRSKVPQAEIDALYMPASR